MSKEISRIYRVMVGPLHDSLKEIDKLVVFLDNLLVSDFSRVDTEIDSTALGEVNMPIIESLSDKVIESYMSILDFSSKKNDFSYYVYPKVVGVPNYNVILKNAMLGKTSLFDSYSVLKETFRSFPKPLEAFNSDPKLFKNFVELGQLIGFEQSFKGKAAEFIDNYCLQYLQGPLVGAGRWQIFHYNLFTAKDDSRIEYLNDRLSNYASRNVSD